LAAASSAAVPNPGAIEASVPGSSWGYRCRGGRSGGGL